MATTVSGSLATAMSGESSHDDLGCGIGSEEEGHVLSRGLRFDRDVPVPGHENCDTWQHRQTISTMNPIHARSRFAQPVILAIRRTRITFSDGVLHHTIADHANLSESGARGFSS